MTTYAVLQVINEEARPDFQFVLQETVKYIKQMLVMKVVDEVGFYNPVVMRFGIKRRAMDRPWCVGIEGWMQVEHVSQMHITEAVWEKSNSISVSNMVFDITIFEHKCEYCGTAYKPSEFRSCPACGGVRPVIQDLYKTYDQTRK
jgi:hypothetical protein